MSKWKFGDLVKPTTWNPQLIAVVIDTSENGVVVTFDPSQLGGSQEFFRFTDDSVEKHIPEEVNTYE